MNRNFIKKHEDLYKRLYIHILCVSALMLLIYLLIRNINAKTCPLGSNQTTFLSKFGLGIALVVIAVVLFIVAYEQVKAKIIFRDYMESQKKYEDVVNNINEVIFQTDKGGKWTFLNPAWTEITGLSLKECLGSKFLNYVYAEDRERHTMLFKPLIERKKDFFRDEVRFVKKDGSTWWVEVYATLIIDNNGDFAGTSGTLRNITRRKRAELDLEKKDRLLNGIAQASNTMLHLTDGTALDKALAILGKVTEVDLIYIFKNEIVEENNEPYLSEVSFWYKHNNESKNQKEDYIPFRSTWRDIGILRWHEILSSGKTFGPIISQLPEEERGFFIEKGIKSVLIMPIFIDDKFWGIVGFEDHTEERAWSEVEKNTLTVAAANFGGVFKRRQAEEALKEAMQDDFKQTVQNLQNIVFRIKRNEKDEFCFTLLEGKYGEKIGINTNNIYGKTLEEVFPRKVAAYLRDNLETAFNGNITEYELGIGRSVVYVTLTPIYRDGIVAEVVGSGIDITNQKKAEEKIRTLAYFDSLTGLPNRTLFYDKLSKEIEQAELNGRLLSILFLDFDRFKIINDTLGHDIGDLMLKEISKRLKKCMGKDKLISRMGGDEFVILLSDIDNKKDVQLLAQKILDCFGEPIIVAEHELFITTSIGISMYPHNGSESSTLIKNADTAMYRAKGKGGNNYEFYAMDMNDRALERLEMENDLRRAIERNELYLLYQPKVELKTGKIVGAEALLRWRHHLKGIVSPADFIPLAEETGLIVPIGEWVLKAACLQTKAWHEKGYDNLYMAVNISPQQFLRGSLVSTIKAIVEETGINPRYMNLEITEGCLMENSGRNMEIVKRLKEIGMDISVDDFGKGFSSLSYLKQFDVDVLKVDSSFIKDIPEDSDDMAITTAIISMAHDLNLRVVAEGVETQEQLDFLLSKNCDEMQGYFFSRPVESHEFEMMLLEDKQLFYSVVSSHADN